MLRRRKTQLKAEAAYWKTEASRLALELWDAVSPRNESAEIERLRGLLRAVCEQPILAGHPRVREALESAHSDGDVTP